MQHFYLLFLVVSFNFSQCTAISGGNFLTSNASLAVILDEDFLQKQNDSFRIKVSRIIEDAIRDNSRSVDLNVEFYSWSVSRLRKDFVAALVIAGCSQIWKFYKNFQKTTVIILAITETNCPRLPSNKAITIPIMKFGDEISQIFLDIRDQSVVDWKSCLFLVDSIQNDLSSQIYSSLADGYKKTNQNPLSVYLYKMNLDSKGQPIVKNIQETLLKLKRLGNKNYVVFSSFLTTIFKAVQEINMFNVFNQWLFLIPNSDNQKLAYDLVTNISEAGNIVLAINNTNIFCTQQDQTVCIINELVRLFISVLYNISSTERTIYGDISDEEWETIRLDEDSKQEKMVKSMQEQLKSNNKCESCIQWKFISRESWGRNYKYINHNNSKQSNKKTHNDIAVLNDKYSELKNSAIWNFIVGFSIKDVIFPHIHHKFRNLTLKIITYNNPPWQIVNRAYDGKIINVSGIIVEIVLTLGKRLNFSCDWYEIMDESKFQLANGIFSVSNKPSMDLLNSFSTKNVFLVAIATTIDQLNGISFNFTSPISVQKYNILSRRPGEVSRVYIFTAPFTPATWSCLTAMLILTTPFLYIIIKLSPVNKLHKCGLLKMKSCFWHLYGALLQQGGLYMPKADSGRVIIGVWWVGVIVLVSTYCGSLVAFLTFPKFQQGTLYIKDAFSNEEIKSYGLRNETFIQEYSRVSVRNDLKTFVSKATLYEKLTTMDLDAIKKGEKIFVDWVINLRHAIHQDFEQTKMCNFMLGNEEFLDERIGVLLPAGSPFLDLINEEIKRLHQMGFINRLHKIYLQKNDQCREKPNSRETKNHMVNLNDMQGCFLVLVLGFMVSSFVIICEFLGKILISKKKIKNSKK